LVLSIGLATSAGAATFTVTTLADSGPGSLRDAVAQANAAPGPDTIDFAVSGTISLAGGVIPVLGPLTLQGPGAANLTLDGLAQSRILVITDEPFGSCPAPSGPSDYLVTIRDLTLTNARHVADDAGGAIKSWHSLTLDGVVIRDSHAKGGGAVAMSAQYPGQALTISGSQLVDNRARQLVPSTTGYVGGGAVQVSQHCVAGLRTTPVTVAITNTLLSGNQVLPSNRAGAGRAIDISQYADVQIVDTRIVDNLVAAPTNPDPGQGARAGAINARPKYLRLERSEVADNAAPGNSAFAFLNPDADLQGAADAAVIQLINSTVIRNTASGSSALVFGNVSLQLYNTTWAGNVPSAAGFNAGLSFTTGAGLASPTLHLESSILWNPLEGGLDINVDTASVAGSLDVTANRSLIGKVQAYEGIVELVGSSNLLGLDPALGPLAFNGGSTRTMPLLASSPAIDAGSNPLALSVDQRAGIYGRVQGPSADIGAFEYPASCAGFLDIDPANAFCSNAQWLKNRAITLGCAAGQYCPASSVNRLGMAAFMNRLGGRLSPGARYFEQAIGPINPDADDNFFCFTPELPAVPYPRRVQLTAVFAGTSASEVGLVAGLVATVDWGTTPLPATAVPMSIRPGTWVGKRLVYDVDLPAGLPLLAAVRVVRGDGPAGTMLADGSCRLRMMIDNQNGGSAPFDEGRP